MIPLMLARLITFVVGTLYPTYASYKALKTKTETHIYNWMAYWIVIAISSSFEGIADVLFGVWLPFYLELKLVFHVWLILPITQRSLGSGIIYQRFIQPYLKKREGYIDKSIATFQEQSYSILVQLGIKAFHYMKTWILQFAVAASTYGAEFIEKHRYAEISGRNEVSIWKHAYQNIIESIRTQSKSAVDEYDNQRFEEINRRSELNSHEVQQIEDVAVVDTNANIGSKIRKNLPAAIKEKGGIKSRGRPKRKAAPTTLELLDAYSSDDMEVDGLDDIEVEDPSYVPSDSTKINPN